MILLRNPSAEQIQGLIEASHNETAKWIEDKATGEKWFWPADQAFHAHIAGLLHITEYNKGLAIT